MSASPTPDTGGASVRIPFAAVVLAMLPAVLDQTVLSTALPTIALDLGRLTDVSWVVTAYVVAAAAATPLWGRLGDRLGRRAVLEAALALFLVSSAACGLAQDMTVLVATRAVQGVAAGGLMSLAMAAVGDLVSPRERGRYQGYIAAVFAVATIAGPLLGGLLVEHASWRWVFYVNLPLGAVALVGLRTRLPAVPGSGNAPLDLAGAALLAGATGAFMLACIRADARVALLAAAGLLAAALVVRERRASDPIVPLDLLRRPAVGVASAALFLTTAALFAVTVFVPLFLQRATGATPTQAGLLLVPMMLGLTVSTNLAGRAIQATGRYKRYPVIGLAAMTGALAALAVAAAHPSRVVTGLVLVVFGLGFGMVGQVLTVAVQNDVDRRQLGTAMAATTFFRGLGGAVGAAVLGAVFAARTQVPIVRAELLDALQTVFWCAAPIALLAFAVTLALPETPLAGAPRSDAAPGGQPRVVAST